MTLLILAAGMGSRFGGLKQLTSVTDNGEFIIDFSVYDAVNCGFDKIVFVIKEENLEMFKQTVGSRFENKIKVEYAFQRIDDLPDGFKAPEGREKPWGTAQAMLAARHIIKEPFAVINADDFYGRSAYALLSSHLSAAQADKSLPEYCMVGYVLENTLTENGTVSRGICKVSDGYLDDVVERTKISRDGNIAVCDDGVGDRNIALDSIVSMNCWGFTPEIFDKVYDGFARFLEKNANEQKAEYYLPFAVRELMESGDCKVRVYSSQDSWYGVTYREDTDSVVKNLAKLKHDGVYPSKFNDN